MAPHRRLAVALLGSVLLLLPLGVVQADSYTIELHNGRQFSTDHYWVEGDRVMLRTSGGVLGFAREAIKEIREVKEKQYEEVRTQPAAPTPSVDTAPGSAPQPTQTSTTVPPTSQNELPQADTATAKPEQGGQAGDRDTYLQKRAELTARVNEYIEKFHAASGEQNTDEKQKARQEMLKYSNQLFDLQEEVKQKHNGALPDWWEKL